MSTLDSLLDNFECSDDEEDSSKFDMTNLPQPPPSIADKALTKEARAPVERSLSGTFQKFNIQTDRNEEEKQRLYVLQELITSEQDFVKDVAYVVNVSCVYFIPKEEIYLFLSVLLGISSTIT